MVSRGKPRTLHQIPIPPARCIGGEYGCGILGKLTGARRGNADKGKYCKQSSNMSSSISSSEHSSGSEAGVGSHSGTVFVHEEASSVKVVSDEESLRAIGYKYSKYQVVTQLRTHKWKQEEKERPRTTKRRHYAPDRYPIEPKGIGHSQILCS